VVNGLSNTVTPINTATNRAGKPIPVGKDPGFLAITPNGATVYVSNLVGRTVTPISTATNTAGPPIKVGVAPGQIAITPNGRTAYVLNTNFYANTMRPINIATNTVGPAIKVGPYPHEIAITPDGKTAYVACFNVNVSPGQQGVGSVRPVHLATNTVRKPISMGHAFPDYFAINASSTTAYVTSEQGLTPISVATNTAGRPIPAGNAPWAVALNAAGTRAWVTDIGGPNAPARAVTVLNLVTRTTLKTITVGLRPLALLLVP
jgi:YVTN family beta-propeller protein